MCDDLPIYAVAAGAIPHLPRPNDAQAWINLGLLYRDLDQLDAAAKAFGVAVRLGGDTETPGSLGHRRMADYVIGDAIVTPQGSEANFAETIVRMPVTYQPTDASRASGPAARQDHGLPADALVLCCFSQAYKITEERAHTWFRVMAAVPTSYLWLLDMPDCARSALLGIAEIEGIAASRILWAPRVPQTQHVARLSLVDLALDTFPYTSHTTASDALWAGVPLLTRIGETMASRVAASVLSAAGMDDLIVGNEEAYQAAAISMLQNRDRLAEAKRAAAQASESRLFDTTNFAADLYMRLLTLRAPGAGIVPELPHV